MCSEWRTFMRVKQGIVGLSRIQSLRVIVGLEIHTSHLHSSKSVPNAGYQAAI